ncbi:MAG: hypothetical protein KF703_17045 [Actinobacteria bacterium]|nr:hypothetical protein [Actinomycetota bacterium]
MVSRRICPRRRRLPAATVAVAVALVATVGALGPGGPAASAPRQASPPSLPVAQEGGGPGLLPVPDPLPAGAPGDLIAEAPFDSGPFDVRVEAHQVLYRSTDRDGRPTPVSGIVLVPVGVPAPAGGRGVVAWAHGTTGLVDGCAPSLDNQQGARLNSPDSYDRIDAILAAGHVVAASDYPGLGTPGVHPYLDGVGEGRAVLDSIRVARRFGGTSIAVVEGFSQGSQAAIFAGQEWSSYAPDIDLRAVVAIGTPARYGQAFAALDLPVVRSYIGKVLAGIVAGHPELDRSQILTPSGERAYDRFAALDRPDGSCESPDFDPATDIRTDPMTVPAWRAAFEANDPGRALVPVPVLMVQSEADEQALAFLADGVCRDLVANGADVRMWRYDDESHVDSVRVSADDRMTWILDRLDGAPLTDAVAFTGEPPRVLAECPGEDASEPTPPATEPDGSGGSGTTTPPPARAISGRAAFTG